MKHDLANLRRRKARGEELTDEEFEFLSKFWRSGASTGAKTGSGYDSSNANSPFAGFVAEVTAIREARKLEATEPGILYCSFCGKRVSEFEATLGKTTKIYVREDLVETDQAPDALIEESIIAKNQKVVACPDHALMIKPRIDKHGNYLGHNIDYRAFSLE